MIKTPVRVFDGCDIRDANGEYVCSLMVPNLKTSEIANEIAAALNADINKMNKIIFDMFFQGCIDSKGKYNHQCIWAWQNAQYHLIRAGLIKKEDCEED